MSWPVVAYVVLLLFSTSSCATLALVAWRRRDTPGGTPLAFFLLASSVWTLGVALQTMSLDVASNILWSKVEYLGIATAGTCFFAFALQYGHQAQWLTRRLILVLSVEPFLTLLIVATNEWHGLLWNGFVWDSSHGGRFLVYGHAIWFWINVAYNSLLAVIAVLLLAHEFIRSYQSLYRQQAIAISIGALSPLVGSSILAAGFNPFPGLDLSPIPLMVTALAFAWGVFRFRLLDIVPVARGALVEKMGDGVLVIDLQDRVVDMNRAARKLLGRSDVTTIGARLEHVFAAWPDFLVRLHAPTDVQQEIALEGDPPLYLHVHASPLFEQGNRLTGRLIILRDNTAQRLAEQELKLANEELHSQLDHIQALQVQLREQAIRDALTGAFNRYYLTETLERELARSRREGTPVSLVMMDIDQLKAINDQFGHKGGDLALQVLGELLQKQIRVGDLACRYGGDEFVVIMPGAPLGVAKQRAEGWRKEAELSGIICYGEPLHLTISLGIASFPEHGATGDELLRASDEALYAAKRAGRNCTVTWDPHLAFEGWTGSA